MFDYLDSKELLFLMRVSTSFKLAESLDSEDSILEYKINGKLKKVRVIKVLNIKLFDASIITLFDAKKDSILQNIQ